MTVFTINVKEGYGDTVPVGYRGDLKGAFDFIRGILTVSSTSITAIELYEEGEAQ